ncbi:MAG: hypothetical protein HZB09_01215 [Candidatus Yonathbacteria bacterium]|nr:hypothetical protein [Candidatus Yonathbacteria bacterium]
MMNTPTKKLIVAAGALVVLVLVSCGLTGCKWFGNSSGSSNNSTATDTNTAEIPGLPPDPGEAGKATLAGIITNPKGVRDDIYRYIVINHQDSEKTREALFQKARVWQDVLLDANDKAKSINHAEKTLQANACLRYIRPQDASVLIDSLISMVVNTDARHKAYEVFDRQIGGQVFSSYDELKTVCTFDPDSFPN